MDNYEIIRDAAGTWSVMYKGQWYIATFQNLFDAKMYLNTLISGKTVSYELETLRKERYID